MSTVERAPRRPPPAGDRCAPRRAAPRRRRSALRWRRGATPMPSIAAARRRARWMAPLAAAAAAVVVVVGGVVLLRARRLDDDGRSGEPAGDGECPARRGRRGEWRAAPVAPQEAVTEAETSAAEAESGEVAAPEATRTGERRPTEEQATAGAARIRDRHRRMISAPSPSRRRRGRVERHVSPAVPHRRSLRGLRPRARRRRDRGVEIYASLLPLSASRWIGRAARWSSAPHHDGVKPGANVGRHGREPVDRSELAIDLADAVENVVGTIRDRATTPVVKITRGIVYGLMAAFVAITALVSVVVGMTRALQSCSSSGCRRRMRSTSATSSSVESSASLDGWSLGSVNQ